MAFPAAASAASATLTSPPGGAVYYTGYGSGTSFPVTYSASFNRDAACGAHAGGVEQWVPSAHGGSGGWASKGGSAAGSFSTVSYTSPGDYLVRAWLVCDTQVVYSGVQSFSVKSGNPPPSGPEAIAGAITNWVQNILNSVVKPKYNPCDYGAVAGGAQNADCGQAALRNNPQFWKANGSQICAVGVGLSAGDRFTGYTTGSAVKGCVDEFPPPKRQAQLRRAGSGEHSSLARGKSGKYRGWSTSIATLGQPATDKKLRRSGGALVRFLRSNKKPPKANRISVQVTKHGRQAIVSAGLDLTCEDGSTLPVDLVDMPGPSAPIPVPRNGYFQLQVEDPNLTARIGGYLVDKRTVAGAFYLGVRFHQVGLCDALVGYAARKG